MARRYWINYLKEYIFTPTAPANSTTSQTGTFKALVERVLAQASAYSGKPWYQTPDTTLSNASTHISDSTGGAHGGVYNKLQKDGVDVAKQRIANFTGPGVTVSDDGVNGRTNIDIPGGAGGGGGGSAHIIQEEGSTLTARSRLNFRGVGATASDDSGNDRTNVDIRGNVHRSTTAPTSPVSGEAWVDSTTNPATSKNYNGSTFETLQAVPTDSSVTDIKVASGAGIAKSKLGALSIDTADLATNRALLITCTSSTRPSSPVTGQSIYETDTQLVMINTGTPGAPVWTSITASSAYQNPGFISGLQLTWDAGNTLGIETGAAYIEGSSAVIEVDTRLTRAVTFSASQTAFSHVYLFDNGGSPDILVTTDPPDNPYFGTARSKGAGGTAASAQHRHLGSIRPNGAATPAMYKWNWNSSNSLITYLENIGGSPFRVVNDSDTTTENTDNCAGIVPPTSKLAKIHLRHYYTSTLYIGSSEDNTNLGAGEAPIILYGGASAGQIVQVIHDVPLASNQTFTHRFSSAPNTPSNGFTARVMGYYLSR